MPGRKVGAYGLQIGLLEGDTLVFPIDHYCSAWIAVMRTGWRQQSDKRC